MSKGPLIQSTATRMAFDGEFNSVPCVVCDRSNPSNLNSAIFSLSIDNSSVMFRGYIALLGPKRRERVLSGPQLI